MKPIPGHWKPIMPNPSWTEKALIIVALALLLLIVLAGGAR